MKKTVLVLVVAVMVIGTMSVAFADASWGPLGILESLSGKTEAEIFEMRDEDQTLGELADELGVYEDFRDEALVHKKDMIAQLVEEGKLTQERAEEIIAAFENCDGTMDNPQRLLQGEGIFGQKAGNGQGNGLRAMDGEGLGAKEGAFGQGQGQMRRGGRN
ncbi:DUF2680 domain-containing protein [Gudongella sp. DL1XJH-153]|uniref:DUF2680 domain-containing protein n=1 Tax=Gudongella sp. DL1XJH-153 TaxID=3409804 RepID=UPI003BB566F0